MKYTEMNGSDEECSYFGVVSIACCCRFTIFNRLIFDGDEVDFMLLACEHSLTNIVRPWFD